MHIVGQAPESQVRIEQIFIIVLQEVRDDGEGQG